MKQRLEIRIDENTRAALEIEARRADKSLNAIVEKYIQDGLARSLKRERPSGSAPPGRSLFRDNLAHHDCFVGMSSHPQLPSGRVNAILFIAY